eukprot:12879958-Ditylum_brightwellii.AAC.1
MASSKSNIDYKNNYFEYQELTPIQGEPTTAALLNLCSKVRSNVQSVDTMLGGGANGHLGLVCDTAIYASIPGASTYLRPLNPGQLIVTSTAMQAQMAQLQDQHEDALHLFREVTNVECTITQHIVKMIEAKYLNAIRNT